MITTETTRADGTKEITFSDDKAVRVATVEVTEGPDGEKNVKFVAATSPAQ
jgi:hypothetical protein